MLRHLSVDGQSLIADFAYVRDVEAQGMFGKVIRSEREASGISQEALADKAGLHRTYISLLERGLRNPSLTVITQLADALGKTPAFLMTEFDRLRKQGK